MDTLPRDKEGVVAIPLVLSNSGNTPLKSSGCALFPAAMTVNAKIQKRVDGAWVGRNDPSYRCSPPTIGRLDLAIGEVKPVTLLRFLVPGRYRIRAFLRTLDAELGDWFATNYRTFTVEDNRGSVE